MARFQGPWFVTPSEIPARDGQLFYRQEALLSTITDDSNPLLSIVGKCCVLEMKEYVAQRPTQYAESDVYVCESVFDEGKRCVRGPIQNGLKAYDHSAQVHADEVYFFKNPIIVTKVNLRNCMNSS